jgi:hypothetical protein
VEQIDRKVLAKVVVNADEKDATSVWRMDRIAAGDESVVVDEEGGGAVAVGVPLTNFVESDEDCSDGFGFDECIDEKNCKSRSIRSEAIILHRSRAAIPS